MVHFLGHLDLLFRDMANHLLLVTREQKKPVLIICRVSLGSQPVSNVLDKTIIQKKAEVILKEETNRFADKAPNQSLMTWARTLENLERLTIRIFFRDVISSENAHHSGASDSINRLWMSFSDDLLFAIPNGMLLTSKHTSIALGLF